MSTIEKPVETIKKSSVSTLVNELKEVSKNGKLDESVVLEDSDNIDDLLNDDNEIIDIDIDEEVVPDKVKEDDTSNDIDLDIKNTQETVSYTGWRKVSEAVSDSKIKEELEDEQEENAIESIDKEPDNPDSNLKLSYDYDDDELIDITIDND